MTNKNHQPDCKWEKTTNEECEYRDTHHYCPHAEHACSCIKEVMTPRQDREKKLREEFKEKYGHIFSLIDEIFDFFSDHHKEHVQKVVEGLKKLEKVCIYCHDTHYMRVDGKLHRGCVWCDNGKKKEGLEPDQLTSLNVEYNQALKDISAELGITEEK